MTDLPNQLLLLNVTDRIPHSLMMMMAMMMAMIMMMVMVMMVMKLVMVKPPPLSLLLHHRLHCPWHRTSPIYAWSTSNLQYEAFRWCVKLFAELQYSNLFLFFCSHVIHIHPRWWIFSSGALLVIIDQHIFQWDWSAHVSCLSPNCSNAFYNL